MKDASQLEPKLVVTDLFNERIKGFSGIYSVPLRKYHVEETPATVI